MLRDGLTIRSPGGPELQPMPGSVGAVVAPRDTADMLSLPGASMA